MRRKTETVYVGQVPVGGKYPVVIQSMTNTDTTDIKKTVKQISNLANAGSELVRITVNNHAAASAVPAILEDLDKQNIKTPIIGDFHYNGHLLLTKYSECARLLAKYRINPGNVGVKTRDKNFAVIIEQAIKYNKPVRIGVNQGSLDQQLLGEQMDLNSKKAKPLSANEVTLRVMVESALRSAKMATHIGLAHNKIILSVKSSGAPELIRVNRMLAEQCDFPIHLGLTEAGVGNQAVIASTAALAILLEEGIGDTIRISLTPEHDNRLEEVYVAQQILQSLGLKNYMPQVISCPGCGRTSSTLFQELAAEITHYIHLQMPEWRIKYPGVENMKVAVMGCVVNGPGESKHANIGISLPGRGEKPKAPVYQDGKLKAILKGNNIASEFKTMLDDYVKLKYQR